MSEALTAPPLVVTPTPVSRPNAAYENPIPAAVRAAAERADALFRQANTPPPPAEPASTTVVDPAQPELPGIPATPVVANPGQPTPPPGQTADNWEQRYRTLEGKYNAEVPTLNGTVRQLQGDLQGMRDTLAAMSLANANRPALPSTEIPKEDAEAFGPDLIEASQRWAMARVAPEMQALRDELAQMRGQGATTARKVGMQALSSYMDQNVPGWLAIDGNQQFIDWLNQPDPFAGQLRTKLFLEARDAGDFARFANFYRAFAAEHTATQVPPRTHQTQTPVPQAPAAATVPLESLAAPGAARPGAEGGAPQDRYFTNQEIAAFYRDVQRGVYIGRDAEKLQTEQAIIAASRSGRVR